MYKVFVENTISKCGDDYNNCYFCNDLLITNGESGVLEHLNETSHTSFASSKVWHKIPKTKELEKIELLSETDYRQLVENNIYFANNYYYCNFCCHRFNDFVSVEEHINDEKHQSSLRINFKNLLENHIIFKNQAYYCKICENQCKRIYHAEQHIKGRRHEKNKKIYSKENIENKDQKDNTQQIVENDSMALQENCIKLIGKKNFKCLICNFYRMPIDKIILHIFTNNHLINYNSMKLKKNYFIENREICKENEYLFCTKCRFYLTRDDTSIQCHCMLHLYKEHLELNVDVIKYNVIDKKIFIECLLCKYKTKSELAFVEHAKSVIHLRKLQQNLLYETKDQDDFIFKINNDVLLLDSYKFDPVKDLALHTKSEVDLDHFYFYRCFLCHKSFLNIKLLFNHYNNDSVHKYRLQSFYAKENCKDKNFCLTISQSISSVIGEKHISNNLVQRNSEKKEKEEKSEKQRNETCNDDTNILHVPITSDKLTQNKPKKTPKLKKKPNKLCPTDVNINSNDSNQQSSNNRKNEPDYLSSSVSKNIESGNENIYNFSADEINLMQLGISLIVPSGDKGFCIPCAYKIKLDLQRLYEHLQNEVHIENMCDLKSSGDFSDENELSHLDLAKLGLFEKSDEEIKCLMCDLTFPNTNDDIKLHQTKDHASKIMSWKQAMKKLNDEFFLVLGEFWYYADKYLCTICDLNLKRESVFLQHLEHPKHLRKIQSVEENHKVNKCLTCLSCWYGVSDYCKHCETKSHNAKTNHKFRIKINPNVYDLLVSPNAIAKKLIIESDRAMEYGQYLEKRLLKEIENTARNVYPEAKAYLFGSRRSCLGLSSSDMDVFLDCENIYKDVESQKASQNYIRNLQNHFFISGKYHWKKIAILTQARVPIIKLEHRFTHIKCDLSFMNGLGVEKTQLIRSYVVAYKCCRELIMFLKQWFVTIDLYGLNGINAYAISWFAIFYLQVEGIFPSVYQLIKQNNQSKNIGGWECGFPKKVPVSDKAPHNFENLLRGFFSYYANFDYCTKVVCPFVGKVMKKSDFMNIEDLPEEMEIYKNYFLTEKKEYFPYDSPMCIQDPVDLPQNITKNLKKYRLRIFREHCKASLMVLQK